jgi:hypothetical protein
MNCKICGGTEKEKDPIKGFTYCKKCNHIFEESQYVSSLQFTNKKLDGKITNHGIALTSVQGIAISRQRRKQAKENTKDRETHRIYWIQTTPGVIPNQSSTKHIQRPMQERTIGKKDR